MQVLGSQLAFAQHLFRREPEVLKCQEDERLQLEVRAKALQQQALEQEVASQRRLQVCSAHLLKAIRIHIYTNEKFLVEYLWKNVLFKGGVCAPISDVKIDVWVSLWTRCRSGPSGRIIVVDWVVCWTSVKPSSAVENQRESMRRSLSD